MTLQQTIHIGICNGAAMEKAFCGGAIALAFVAEYEIELEAGVTGTTAELVCLITRALERMLEQFFNCFTDGLEL